MKFINATIMDVQTALAAFIAAAKEDSALEAKSCKKLAGAANFLVLKDDITKDLNYAYTNAEKKWAVNYADEKDSCTKANKADKIKQYICGTVAYNRLISDPVTKNKVESWLKEKFPVMTTEIEDQAA